ncbi:PREDICTED: ADP-ribosylation factor-like protein 3 [Nelumbo nucifera]|uniref:ADP-ribosylation factor-like protein 3 n=1 Tax=Nelumbo nucifera TaxID=4432 RepID=A0A1U8A335_NELNU|nr:PREDICTED: ADP-ribosylation factor-like protein 3 [Nelumbo nucifera]
MLPIFCAQGSTGQAGIGGVIRGCGGSIFWAFSGPIGRADATKAEILPALTAETKEKAICEKAGLRTIWEKYYEEAHAVIYVIDAACPTRFEDSKSALEKLLRHEDLQGAPLLILANKQDLAGAVSAAELARYLDLKELDERPYMFEAVSAHDGRGIKEGVDWLIEVMERSKRTEMLGVRADVTGPVSA